MPIPITLLNLDVDIVNNEQVRFFFGLNLLVLEEIVVQSESISMSANQTRVKVVKQSRDVQILLSYH